MREQIAMEGWRQRGIIALRPNYRPPATMQGKLLKPVGAPKDYILSNCAGCGWCCRAIAMSPQIQDQPFDMPPGWRPITEKEAYKINPWLKGQFPEPKVWFTCDDLENGSCKNYVDRKPVCRQYPLFEATFIPDWWEGAVPWCFYNRLKLKRTNKPVITIATPVRRGDIAPEYVMSLVATLQSAFFEFKVVFQEGSIIYVLRNFLTRKFRDQFQGDYLLFIDSDMAWDPQDIKALVDADKDIVSGFCFNKNLMPEPIVCPIEAISGELFQVEGIGTGFMLIKNKVIRAFDEAKIPPFDPVLRPVIEDDHITRYLPEDISFCEMARQLGFEVWCEPKACIGHVGSRIIMEGSAWGRWTQTISSMLYL